MRHVLRLLLALALLHLSVAPAWAAASPRRWPARLAASLEIADALRPGHAMPFKAWLLDGRVLEGELLAVVEEADSLYQPRLTQWQARDSARAALPLLGQKLDVPGRFEAGRPVQGVFRGFSGPRLLLGRTGGASNEVICILFAGEPLTTATGHLTLDGGVLDRSDDWPPSRAVFLISTAQGTQRVSLDELQDLQISRRLGVEGYVVGTIAVFVVLALAALFLLVRSINWPEIEVS